MKKGMIMQWPEQCCLAMAFLVMPLVAVSAEESAEYIETRHGAVTGWANRVVEGGITAVAQHASDGRIDTDLTTSLDLVVTVPVTSGHWVLYLEGNTTPRRDAVSSLLGEANWDAGSALDRNDRGRLQVSALHFVWDIQPRQVLLMGLLIPTVSMDTSEVANDETSQFVTGSLVNNPTIDFPDYTPGLVYNHEFNDEAGFTLMLTSSHGLADNPKRTYSQLLDVGDDGKGVFAAAEAQWQVGAIRLLGGAWLNSADHERLDGSGGMEENYGIYTVVDGHLSDLAWNVRLGAANAAVSQAARFASLALEYPFRQASLGAGVAHSWLSEDDPTPGLEDASQAELYARFDISAQFSLTPMVQWLANSGFDGSGATVDEHVTLYGLRANFTF